MNKMNKNSGLIRTFGFLAALGMLAASCGSGDAAVKTTAEEGSEATTAGGADAEAAGSETGGDYTIGFLAGVDDPFYITMQRGAEEKAKELGVELAVQIPPEWNVTEQTPILEAMTASGDLDFLFLAPVDAEAMVAPLEAVVDKGVPIITVDTSIGDGDYEAGPVTFPLSYIGSENVEGGKLACEALIESIGGSGNIYIQNVTPGISTTDQREEGCREVIDSTDGVELVGVDYNDNDPAKAATQTAAALTVNEIDGIFGTNVNSAEGAGNTVSNQGADVQVVAFDATARAIELLNEDTVTHVVAQDPAAMGAAAVENAVAYLNDNDVEIERRIATGYQLITSENVEDPEVAKFIYKG